MNGDEQFEFFLIIIISSLSSEGLDFGSMIALWATMISTNAKLLDYLCRFSLIIALPYLYNVFYIASVWL